jgi:DNA-binding NtrC family response regulator
MTETTGARVLIVDDDAASRRMLEVRLRALGCEVALAADGEKALAAVESQPPTVMLLDLRMPRLGGMELLRMLRKSAADFPVIVITAHGSIETAVEAMKEGAYDFLPKPFDSKHLEIVVCKALEREALKREVEFLSEETDKRYRLIVGESVAMKEAVDIARKAAASKTTVLLLGESGTGKEILARAIHTWSERNRKPFVAINCVGLSKELLESELFGHEKGAFTGAHEAKKGKMELAHGGTVLLDEVGDISSELQTKLLRFLQEREFDRVGGLKPVSVDVRVIAATNRDLRQAVTDGRFREDLYHRLDVIAIALPPLRERRSDIPALARYFQQRFSSETKRSFSEIAPAAEEKLVAYDWPGNVRELANVIERAVVLGHEPTIAVHDLPPRIVAAQPQAPAGRFSYRAGVDASRRELVLKALSQTGGNRAAAAKVLGIQRTYLLKLMKALGIDERL